MCRSLQHLIVGKDLEADILSDVMGWSRSLTQDGQLRWIGPEKGVLAMACGAVINAVWDLWARIEGKPLWELVVDMEPEQLVELKAQQQKIAFGTQTQGNPLFEGLRDAMALIGVVCVSVPAVFLALRAGRSLYWSSQAESTHQHVMMMEIDESEEVRSPLASFRHDGV